MTRSVRGPTPAEAGSFDLLPDEREPLAEMAEAYAAAVPEDLAGPYRRLTAAARAGTVPSELSHLMERVCALALQTGKARAQGRAEAERALMAVLRRSPGGLELAASLEEVNRALSSLAGRPLRSVRAAMRIPGRYTLALEVDGVSLTLGLGPEGIVVESLATG
ncbi:MAG: hypothetical protein ACE14W_04470 [Candidatus Velamenicoccus archaeovorus]